jgi:hypothetical protein
MDSDKPARWRTVYATVVLFNLLVLFLLYLFSSYFSG